VGAGWGGDIFQDRFFFNPIRYTSLGLAVCEAMMVGMPIIGLATTEMATTVQNDLISRALRASGKRPSAG